jgi:UDP-GlcNAc:undecaprenyl-phosphate GlcNAc-1-phosphate transferase
MVIFWVTVTPLLGALLGAIYFNGNGAPAWLPDTLATHIEGLTHRTKMLTALILAAALLHGLGLLDDKHHLGPFVKLIVQLAAALLVAGAGEIRFSFFISNPYITTLLTVLWMVVIINAFNFLDNMDGLSAGIGAICSAMLLSAALTSGQVFVGAFLALLIGVLLGFLVYNFAPAKIFMGDAGSLLVGLFVAVATIQTTYYRPDTQSGMWFSTFMPLVVLAVPLYDFISVTILRLWQGKSPFVGDKQHFSHRLVARGMSRRQAVLTIYLATACTGLGATFLDEVSSAGAVLIFIQTMLIVLIIAILEQPAKMGR